MARKSPEHSEVRLPLIDALKAAGWEQEQLQWQPEWRVPATPSEASKREAGSKFDGFPTDLVIFDRPEFRGDPEHVLIIFETKKPDIETGIHQLQIYLNMEPAARVGVWTNGKKIVRVYRAADGSFVVDAKEGLPKPTESFLWAAPTKLKWENLKTADTKHLRSAFERILDLVVARDTRSTRRDDQLNQVCNLLLAKLESDKLAKADPQSPAVFQTWDTEEDTARRIRSFFSTLRGSHSDLFDTDESAQIALNDHTISVVAYELALLRLFDAPMDVMSNAFQVFRTASLKSEEGQYYTPYQVIQSAIRVMEIHPSDLVIDPACGTGGFLIEAFKSLRERFPSLSEGDAKQWAQRRLFGIDKDRINVKLTKAMMLIVGDGSTHTFRADSLSTYLWPQEFPQVSASVKDGTFTCVLTNPPFGERLTFSDREARLSKYTISQRPSSIRDPNATFDPNAYETREIGIVFLERCWRLLQSGGRLGIILPETYMFSSSYLWLQGWLRAKFELRGILNIPMEAFQGFCRAKTNFYIFEKK